MHHTVENLDQTVAAPIQQFPLYVVYVETPVVETVVASDPTVAQNRSYYDIAHLMEPAHLFDLFDFRSCGLAVIAGVVCLQSDLMGLIGLLGAILPYSWFLFIVHFL